MVASAGLVGARSRPRGPSVVVDGERLNAGLAPSGAPSGLGPHRWAGRVEVAALGVAIAFGVWAWGVGVREWGYDYDEVSRAHSTWLASRGLRPYRDFFEVHPPYFLLLAPVFRWKPDPVDALGALRLVAAVGNLAFLGGLVALASSARAGGRRWAALLGVVLVACRPEVLAFLVEFRVDGWGYALATWALVRFDRSPRGPYRLFEFGVLAGIATALLCPKIALLPPLVVACDALAGWRSPRGVAKGLGACLLGVGLAAGLFWAFLAAQGIGLGLMVQLLGRYHAVSNAHAAFRRGLLGQIVEQRALLAAIGAGAIAWAAGLARRREWPRPIEPALLAWLAIQALVVAYPYKQYLAPWLLFGSVFVAHLARGLAAWPGGLRAAVVVMACSADAFDDVRAARGWSSGRQAEAQRDLIRWMGRVTRPGDRVATPPPLHPIDRRDTFFVWFNTADPGGFDSERILDHLPSYRDRVAPGYARRELEADPPALVVLVDDPGLVGYTVGQKFALVNFLAPHGYQSLRVGPATFALRPDRLEEAQRDGLIPP